LRGRYQLLISPAIVREVAGVLREDFTWEEFEQLPIKESASRNSFRDRPLPFLLERGEVFGSQADTR
jgi:hypothetical protein